MIRTEIDRLKAAHYFYKYGTAEQQNKAEQMLKKVHRQYGTIDVNTVIDIIR